MNNRKNKLANVVLTILLLLVVCFICAPVLWTFSNGFREEDAEIFRNAAKLSIHTLIPESFTLANYREVLIENGFYIPLKNSLIVASITIVGGTILNGMAGYAFAKCRFRGKNVLFAICLFSFVIPFEMIAIPLYQVVGQMHILDTKAALILPMLGNGMIIFLYRQAFMDIPDTLVEAAVMDGANIFTIFFKIMMPLVKPVIISSGLMIFIQQWDAFLWPMLAATSKSQKVVQVAISEFSGETFTSWTGTFTATTIAILIPVMILLPLQKYYIQGISSSGMKE